MPGSDTPHRVHLIGICGTGMGALAGALRDLGHDVRGSDSRAYPPMSDALAAWGVPVLEGYAAANLVPRPDVVVVGNVIGRDHPEAVAARDLGLEVVSLPEAIARFLLPDRRPVVVVGTHGKTTTTSLVAFLLDAAGQSPGFFIGGLPVDFPFSGRLGAPPHFVVEGDEYDSAYFDKRPKFLHYRPAHAILTGIEFDHADIYPDLAAVRSAFASFVRLVPADGVLAVCGHEATAVDVARSAHDQPVLYGLGRHFEWGATTLSSDESGQAFQLLRRGRPDGRYRLPLWGRHNLLNAVGALALLRSLGIDSRPLAEGLARFGGVRRRQQVVLQTPDVTLVDDFGQHPTAVRETLRAVRQRYARRRLTLLFRPESNTVRRSVLAGAFEEALREADRVVLVSALRKARDAADLELLDIRVLARRLEAHGVQASVREDVGEAIRTVVDGLEPPEVVLVMSARALDGGLATLREALQAGSGAPQRPRRLP